MKRSNSNSEDNNSNINLQLNNELNTRFIYDLEKLDNLYNIFKKDDIINNLDIKNLLNIKIKIIVFKILKIIL